MTAKRLLLTGAGGFVGHHTLEHILTNTNWHIVCTDSFRHAGKTSRIRQVLESGPEEWKSRTTVLTHDLTAPFDAQLAAQIGPLDFIISMASESHVDRSLEYPAPFIKNNVDLVINLLEFQKTYNPAAIFLQVSTDEVYGPAPKGHDHAEWEAIKPSNPYSASKAAQEAILYSYWRSYGIPTIITNTMNIVGERQDPEKYVPMTIKNVHSENKVTIHASPEGEPGSRFYLHARNQADALLYLLQRYSDFPLTTTEPGEQLIYSDGATHPPRYHVVGEREIDNLEMAELIAKYVGKSLDYELVNFHQSRPGHDLRYALDGTKLAKLGWTPPVPLEDSLRSTVEWTLDHPDWLL